MRPWPPKRRGSYERAVEHGLDRRGADTSGRPVGTGAPVAAQKPTSRAFHARSTCGLLRQFFPALRQIVAGGPAPVQAKAAPTARLVFWNVERLRHLADIAATLSALKPDAMLLSEIDCGMAWFGNGDRVVQLANRLGAAYFYAVEFIELDLGDVHEQKTHAGEVNSDGFHGEAILSDVALAGPALIRLERRGNWFKLDRHEPRVGGTITLCAEITVAGM